MLKISREPFLFDKAITQGLDDDYELISTITHRNGKYKWSSENLELYFVPKKQEHPTREEIEKKQKGIGYKKTASNYLFKRVK